ncbi:MFS transporter [Shigella flexneri]
MNTQYNSSYIFSITLVATLGGLLFGYDTAVISGTVESLNTVFVAPQNLSESAANSLLGFCVASALIGCIIGGALGGYCSNRFGRRDSLKIAAVLFFISGVGFCLARTWFYLYKPGQHSPYLSGRLCPGICYLSYYWRYWRWFSLNAFTNVYCGTGSSSYSRKTGFI